MTDNSSSTAVSEVTDELDQFVEAFEAALDESQSVDFGAFLPPDDHPAFATVAAEIVRVDLERSWSRGVRSSIEAYRAPVPALFESRIHLQEIAFEEFRLRRLAGEQVLPAEYAAQYGIDTNRWPVATDVAAQHSAVEPTDSEPNVHERLLHDLVAVDGIPQVGSHFDEFELVDELGDGTFARVFLARQGGLANRMVALKVSAGPSGESDRLARLQHTNIVPIYSIHEIDGLCAVCMPYLGRPTLLHLLQQLTQQSDEPPKSGADILLAVEELCRTSIGEVHVAENAAAKQQRHSEPDDSHLRALATPYVELRSRTHVEAVIWVMSRLADGLAFAHQQGIVHRDLKPANVLLANDGEPRILDFNLSDETNGTDATTLVVGGTLPYMSAEHLAAVRSGGRVGPPSDVFALGVILYELLTLKRPFPNRRDAFEDMVERMIADRQRPIPSVRDLNRQVPRAVEAIVRRCLHVDPRHRYPSAVELHEDLQRQRDHLPLRFAADRSPAERIHKWARRHPQLTSAGTVAAIAVLTLLAVMALFVARGYRLATLQARDTFHEFQSRYNEARLGLSLSATDPSLRQQTVSTARQTIGIYGALNRENWRDDTAYGRLDGARQRQLDQQLSELMYLLAERLCDSGEPSEKRRTEASRANQLAISLLGDRSPRAFFDQRHELSGADGESGSAQVTDTRPTEEGSLQGLDVFLDAIATMENREYSRALTRLQPLRDARPLDPALWLVAGNAEVGLGNLAGAEACYTTCIGLLPKSYVGYFYRGRCRLDQGDVAGALHDFDRVLQLQPKLTAARLNRALALRASQKHAEAEQELTRAIDMGNVSTRAYFLRADTRKRLGDENGSRQDRREGFDRTPTDELAWVARGTARLQGDPRGALDDFNEAMRINPTAQAAARNSVYVLIEVLDQKEAALEQLGRMLDIDSRDKVALAARAVLQARMGRRAGALRDVERLLRADPNAKQVFQAACVLALTSRMEAGDARRAAALLAQSFRRDPTLVKLATSDPDLEPIRNADDFKRLVNAANEMNVISLVH